MLLNRCSVSELKSILCCIAATQKNVEILFNCIIIKIVKGNGGKEIG